MELSILVAKIIAIIYISSGIAILIGQLNFEKITESLDNSPALTLIAGLFGIIIGLVLVEYHNVWIKNWTVFITIIGWFFLLGGLVMVVFPKILFFFSKYYRHSRLWGIFMLCFGLLFGYWGFVS